MRTASRPKTDAAQVRAVLKNRAKELARPPETEDGDIRLVEIVEFTLGQEHYAFPSSEVQEVFHLTEITPLPSVPPFVVGVTNVRGRILSVIVEKLLGCMGHIMVFEVVFHTGLVFAVNHNGGVRCRLNLPLVMEVCGAPGKVPRITLAVIAIEKQAK